MIVVLVQMTYYMIDVYFIIYLLRTPSDVDGSFVKMILLLLKMKIVY